MSLHDLVTRLRARSHAVIHLPGAQALFQTFMNRFSQRLETVQPPIVGKHHPDNPLQVRLAVNYLTRVHVRSGQLDDILSMAEEWKTLEFMRAHTLPFTAQPQTDAYLSSLYWQSIVWGMTTYMVKHVVLRPEMYVSTTRSANNVEKVLTAVDSAREEIEAVQKPLILQMVKNPANAKTFRLPKLKEPQSWVAQEHAYRRVELGQSLLSTFAMPSLGRIPDALSMLKLVRSGAPNFQPSERGCSWLVSQYLEQGLPLHAEDWTVLLRGEGWDYTYLLSGETKSSNPDVLEFDEDEEDSPY
jgi:hypothetical protein